MSEITRRATRPGIALSLSAAGVALFVLAFETLPAAAGGLAAALLLLAGMVRGSRRLLAAGGAVSALTLVGAGVAGAGSESLLLAGVASLLSWDAAENALTVGDHLGRETDTTRLEVVHAATTLAVLAVGAGVVYAVALAGSGGQPLTAVVLLLVGVVALVAGVRR